MNLLAQSHYSKVIEAIGGTFFWRFYDDLEQLRACCDEKHWNLCRNSLWLYKLTKLKPS